MKKFILILLSSTFLLSGCKKAAENALDDLILKSMTSGQWIVTNFTENSTNKTADFAGYTFQYHTNKTVDAIKDGNIEKTGNWDGSTFNKTTWAEFPGATLPLTLLNGTWKISNNTWDYVIASQTNGSSTKTFRIDKK